MVCEQTRSTLNNSTAMLRLHRRTCLAHLMGWVEVQGGLKKPAGWTISDDFLQWFQGSQSYIVSIHRAAVRDFILPSLLNGFSCYGKEIAKNFPFWDYLYSQCIWGSIPVSFSLLTSISFSSFSLN